MTALAAAFLLAIAVVASVVDVVLVMRARHTPHVTRDNARLTRGTAAVPREDWSRPW